MGWCDGWCDGSAKRRGGVDHRGVHHDPVHADAGPRRPRRPSPSLSGPLTCATTPVDETPGRLPLAALEPRRPLRPRPRPRAKRRSRTGSMVFLERRARRDPLGGACANAGSGLATHARNPVRRSAPRPRRSPGLPARDAPQPPTTFARRRPSSPAFGSVWQRRPIIAAVPSSVPLLVRCSHERGDPDGGHRIGSHPEITPAR